MVNKHAPIFSIGIPTYSKIELLRQTVQSILDQTFSDFEIIIGNDYTDEILTFEKLELFDSRIRIINNISNLGEADNLNFILSQAKGEFFTWQFDDDVYLNTFFESVYKFFKTKEDLPCIYTNLGYTYGEQYPKIKSKKLKKYNIINGVDFVCGVLQGSISAAGCCGVFKRNLLDEIGGVEKLTETPIAIHSEFLLIINTVRFTQIGYINNKLFLSRDYAGTFSGSTKDYQLYRKAGINLLKRGIPIFYKYCDDNNKQLTFLFGLINTIVEFYIMRLVGSRSKKHIYAIRKFKDELVEILLTNNKHISNKEVDEVNKIFKNKRWLIIRIKSYLKWYSPIYFNKCIKRIRAKIY